MFVGSGDASAWGQGDLFEMFEQTSISFALRKVCLREAHSARAAHTAMMPRIGVSDTRLAIDD